MIFRGGFLCLVRACGYNIQHIMHMIHEMVTMMAEEELYEFIHTVQSIVRFSIYLQENNKIFL